MKLKDFTMSLFFGVEILGMIYLIVKFPLTMITLFILFFGFMYYLLKNAPYDYELWPELYEKPPLSKWSNYTDRTVHHQSNT